METEGNAQGIDDLLDDVSEATEQTEEQPAAEETPAETPEEKAAEQAEEPAESTAEVESQIEKLFPSGDNVDHSGKTVPVEKHTALRKRARNAEAERDALREQQANVDTTALNELAELVGGDGDEYIDKAVLKKVVEKLPDAINSIAQANINKVVTETSTKNLIAKAKNDEISFRKEHDDYDNVVDYAKSRGLVSNEELRQVFASGNVAEAYYNLAAEKIAKEREILGVAKPSGNETKETPPPTGQPASDAAPAAEGDDEIPLDDDAAGFEAFMGGGVGS